MERRLNKKSEEYFRTFKNMVKTKVEEIQISTNDQRVSQLLQFIYDYETLAFEKEDFTKRKRVKNQVPFIDQCCAKRASGEQCTRRKKESNEFCGTHSKGTPHGIITNQADSKITTMKVDIWAQDISGIIYYIDKTGNVYKPEDIMINCMNPRVIAKYKKTGDKYSIPEFNI